MNVLSFGAKAVVVAVLSATLAATSTLAANAPQNQIDWPRFLARHDLVWEQFPPSWNTGGFLGNGELGAMVYLTRSDNRVDFHLGRSDVTDHRKAPGRKTSFGAPGASLQYDYPRLDLGRMALRPAGRIQSGTMRLDLWNTEITGRIVTDLGSITFRAFIPHDRMIEAVEVSSTETMGGRPAPWKWELLPGNPTAPRRLAAPKEEAGQGYQTNPEPVFTEADGLHACVQAFLAGGDYATAWQEKPMGAATSTLLISVANEVPKSSEFARVAAGNIHAAAALSANTLMREHRAWWHAFYPQSLLSVPDAKMESFYWIQPYKFASASHPGGPPIDCLGPFFRITQWPGVWWNFNVQLTYWLPLASNHLDLSQPLIDGIDRSFDSLLAGACNGPGIGDFAWALHNYWLQYRYAGDEAGLREKWFPKGAKLADCYLKRLVRGEDGKLHLPQTNSPEYPGFRGDPQKADITQNTFYFETAGRNPVIETPLSGAAALSQMLLQSWGGKLRVFPAMPAAWKDASFQTLRGEGGFLVSAQRAGGKTAWVALESLAGAACVLKVPDWEAAPEVQGDRAIAVKPVAPGEFALDLRKGERVLLGPTGIGATVRPASEGLSGANSYGVKTGELVPTNEVWPER